ncbi:glycoside hydrolase family 5 protein [Termitidicoccus mucosus]|uniref:Glycoside hydrolase family 5 domain-containing protein n=1 Tax=Termitidicoccus mucosus TaxID=1184151 RepID=A0A178ILB6_9BACT|nr:hypothetical protein AW736_07755 [Opitutaceae bacterium TSB47]
MKHLLPTTTRAALAALIFPLLVTTTPTRAAFSEQIPLVPRTGNGIGTVSTYAGITPVFKPGSDGRGIIGIPGARGEVNLVWTFWGHTRPEAGQWPVGHDARVSITLTAGADVTLTPRVAVNAGGWSEMDEGGPVSLIAGEPVTFTVPLPSPPDPDAPVENLRISLVGKKIPPLVVSALSVGQEVAVALHPVSDDTQRLENPLRIKGEASPGDAVLVRAFDASGTCIGESSVKAGADGAFVFAIDRRQMRPGPLALRVSVGGGPESPDLPLYVYPLIDYKKTLPMVEKDGRHLIVDGKPWAFLGLNYTRFLLEFSLRERANYQALAEDFRKYSDWGITALRVPLHLGMFQPAPGIFPDDPRYTDVLNSYKVETGFFNIFEYAVALAGHYGIRLFIDWHELPTDPYRYFVGGNNHDKGTGKPGTGIGWLYNHETHKAVEPGDPRHTKAVVDTNIWLARRLRGNGNILGFEVPYNEPHSVTDSGEVAWRDITSATIRGVLEGDPARLTFGMPPAWGHSNVTPSFTWMPPDGLTGMAPHHYLGNGPVALRADAKQRKEPWLARDVDATFSHAFYAITLPYSAAPHPVWNGESGEHGYASFLPEMSQRESTPLMIEAQTVQAYASGWTGSLGWTLTGSPHTYAPVVDLYEKNYRRFAPVYAAGPVDLDRAEVLFVQNTAAVPVANGLNHACVPFARLALDLHLAPVHYMTDDQLLATGLVQMAVGLEQVEEVAAGLRYKAAVVDTRNLDSRSLDLLKRSKIPLLIIDDAEALTAETLSTFLREAGLVLDQRTPPGLLLIEGPAHFLVYRRAGEGPAKAYPRLHVEGTFLLVDEDNKVVFDGTAATLSGQGIDIDLPKWRTAIFSIRTAKN